MRIMKTMATAIVAAFMAIAGTSGNALAAEPTGGATAALDCTNAVVPVSTVYSGLIYGEARWTKCDNSINRVKVDLWAYKLNFGKIMDSKDHNPANFGSGSAIVLATPCALGSGVIRWQTQIRSWNSSGVLTSSRWTNSVPGVC
jgi:hypothetical protein